MPRFIKILQLIIAVMVAGFMIFDLIIHGISIASDKYFMLSLAMTLLLEIALFVIYKLIEED